ncbi:MAG TPA: DUF2321 domain-containing protein [Gemmataceae bacterium]|nr:DUF2321 domain-containing protein [Gemmataceae bacterium]
MMSHLADGVQDVMQVCRNGHVITDLLRTYPERGLPYCDRCGADTVIHCSTCGQELPGAVAVGGLQPIGVRQPPAYCATCGAAFPWTEQRRPPKQESLAVLETMLRRLPLVIRQLRVRHGDRPPFRVADERDIEDLLRSILPLHFDDIRPECRTPRYAAGTRTDFLLGTEAIAITIKFAGPNLAEQLVEDTAYYRRERKCRTLVVFLYDAEGLTHESNVLEITSSNREDELEVRCVLISPALCCTATQDRGS